MSMTRSSSRFSLLSRLQNGRPLRKKAGCACDDHNLDSFITRPSTGPSRSDPSHGIQRTTLSSIILASRTLSVMTDVSRGDGLLMSSRASRTAAIIDAAITRWRRTFPSCASPHPLPLLVPVLRGRWPASSRPSAHRSPRRNVGDLL